MDPLSDALHAVRLTGAHFYPVRAAEPWAVEAVSARELVSGALPGAEHLIAYHILLSGTCVAGLNRHEMVTLSPGDVIVFPHGDPHWAASAPGVRVARTQIAKVPDQPLEPVVLGEGGRTDATFVCGFLGCDRSPFNPLLASLPRQFVVRGLREGWLDTFTREVLEESARPRAGSISVLTRLAELMLIEVLRHYAQTLPAGATGWLAALQDPVVGGALARLHAEPARDWTLEGLAHEVAASRSRLAARFAQVVGQPPMQYLAAWRVQMAAAMLAAGGAKVASVAAAVGYESEAAFSRAFKRATGVAPGGWGGRGRGGWRPGGQTQSLVQRVPAGEARRGPKGGINSSPISPPAASPEPALAPLS